LIKRKRDLNLSEKKEISQLLKNSNNSDDYILICSCVYILLDNDKKFESIYSKLTKEQKEKFDDFPIYNLYKKHL
jgi:hypothetical protein